MGPRSCWGCRPGAALLGLPTWYELASVEQGNLADDLLVGGGAGSTVYYDDTAL